jgi:PAS domain S-box-containing protein
MVQRPRHAGARGRWRSARVRRGLHRRRRAPAGRGGAAGEPGAAGAGAGGRPRRQLGLDLDTGASTWSASLYRLLGLDPERAPPTGETFEGSVHPDDRAKVAEEAQAAIRGEKPLDTEFRVVRPDGTIGWLASRGEVVRDEAGRPRLFLGVNFDVTERREAADRQRLLLRELSHRVKNTLATVQGIAASTLAGDRGLAEARETFASRLRALAGTHNLLTASGWGGAKLRALVEAEVKPYGPRATIRGEELTLGPKAAQTLGLALHELATNAVKHGALSVTEGRVEVAWEIMAGAAAPTFHLRWRERGGPPVQAPSRNGFGRRLVERAVPYELKAQVRLDFAADGLVYDLAAPLDEIAGKG